MEQFSMKMRFAQHRAIFEKNVFPRRLKSRKAVIRLYSKQEIKDEPSRRLVRIVPFIIGKNAPTVIFCPGGAYEVVCFGRSEIEIAKGFNERGYNVFIVMYRVNINAHFPKPMEDLARAVNYVKHNGSQFNADTNKLYICGSSAGGHLCAYFGARYKDFQSPYLGNNFNLRPSGIILCYPVISMAKETHHVSCVRLLGSNCTQKEKEDKSVELIADKNYPPTFMWHCDDDDVVPVSNCVRLNERLDSLGVKNSFCRYPTGGHGLGLGKDTSAYGWLDKAVEFLKNI